MGKPNEVELIVGPRFNIKNWDFVSHTPKNVRPGGDSFVIDELPISGPIIRKTNEGWLVTVAGQVFWHAMCLQCQATCDFYVRKNEPQINKWAYAHRCELRERE
jgi:hypothetical protein